MSLEVRHLCHTYMPGSPFQSQAVQDVSFTVEDGEFIGVIGHTGSGKSTMIQHLNGLLTPTSGQVLVDGEDINAKGTDKRRLRQKVGMVFQYPEHQLFEETVEKDISFGPKNQGLVEEEITKRVKSAMMKVGLDYQTVKDKSPFDLSGGQMRRVAIAGVLAMEPKVLVLDEPTAGLDPAGRTELLEMIRSLHRQGGVTVMMVSHSMDDMASLATRLLVMNHGRLVKDASPREVFSDPALLRSIGLDVPQASQLAEKLREAGYPVPEGIYRLDEIKNVILSLAKRK